MNWIPDLSAALPAPRDDEPPELRRRIIAELRDHLECAFQRELVLTGDAEEAIRRVRSKFGDPAQLACKLWFDALKEKIVSQRILVGLCAVMAGTCLGLVLFVWKSTADAAAAAGALLERHQSSQQALLEQSQAHSEKLLKRLESLESSRPPAADDRSDFKIELVKEGSLEPAAGCHVMVASPDHKAAGALQLNELSGPTGIIDCGRVRGERYHVTVSSPFGLSMEKDFFVRSSRPAQTLRVAVPTRPAPQYEVTFDFEWPEDSRERMQEQGLGVLCEFEHPPLTVGEDDTAWRTTTSVDYRGWDEMQGIWFVKPSGEAVWIYEPGPADVTVDHAKFSEGSFGRTAKPVLHWKGVTHSLVVLGIAAEMKVLYVTPSSSSGPAYDLRNLNIAIYPQAAKARPIRRTPVSLQLREGELNRIRIDLPDDLRSFMASHPEMGGQAKASDSP